MSLVLGRDPEGLVLKVTKGAAWWTTLEREDGDWPAGAVITLSFTNGPTWTATIAGAAATWARPASDVASLADRQKVDLTYTTSGQTVLWARGQVDVHA